MKVTANDLADAIGGAIEKAFAKHLAKQPERTKGSDIVRAPFVNRGAEEQRDPRKGHIRLAAMTRFMGAGRGDPERAAKIAEKAGDMFTAKMLMATDFDAGGSLVAPDISTDFFDVLRPRSAIRAMNPQIVPMPNGTMTMNGLTSGATASYRGETQHKNATTVGTGNIYMTEKLLIALVPISNQLLRATSGRADEIVSRDLIAAMAQAEDTNFINGDGLEGRPLGIRQQLLDAHSTAGTSSSVTLEKIDEDLAAMRKQVRGANVDVTDGVYLLDTDVEEDLMKLRSGDVKAFPEMEGSNRLGRYRYVSSNNQSSGVIMFGNAADVLLGESENLRVAMSEEASYYDSAGTLRSAFAEDITVMRVTAGHDIKLRYAASWAEKTAVNYATVT